MTSIQTTAKYDRTNPFHIYYDLDAVNLDKTGTQPPPILRFTEVRNNPYLNAPENYFLSVVRFAIQTPSLPIFIPIVQTGQANPNLTIYSITMEYTVAGNPIVFQKYLDFVPTNVYLPVPSAPLVNQDVSTEYYYIYNYQYIIKMINKTVLDCFNGLAAAVVAAGGVMPTTNVPFFEIDPSGFKSVLFADQAAFADTLVNPIKFFMNSAMYHLMTSYQSDYLGYSGITFGRNYRLKIYSTSVNIFNFPTYNAIQMYQDQSSIALMNPIQSLVFTTSLLPVQETNVSAPKVFGSDSRLTSSNNNVNIAPIITDFEVPFSADNTYRPNIEYSPQSEYRLVDLYGASPISAIELSCFWKTQFGNLVPFYLNSNCKANIKLMFRRKDFNVIGFRP
jgi:hypothetical protein